MRRGGPSDPSSGTRVMWAGIFCTAIGLVIAWISVWGADAEVRQNGRIDANAATALAFTAGGGLLFLLIGAACIYGGLRDRKRAIAIRTATTASPPQPNGAAWKPPGGVTDHLGAPLDFDLDFFAPPPPDIGEVISADTSLRFGEAGRTRWVNLLRAVAVGLLAGSVAWLLMKQLEPRDPPARWIGGGLCTWVVGMIAWGKERFWHACCYVGRNGVARFEAAGDRGRVTGERFLFADATDLKVTRTEREHRWVDFRFDWLDADGRVVFQIAGSYRGYFTGHNPWTEVLYQWGLAAAEAWRLRNTPRPT